MADDAPVIVQPRYDDADNAAMNAIRRRELLNQLQSEGKVSETGAVLVPNERFAGYVQSTAFSMTLSRNQVRALAAIEHAIDRDLGLDAWPVSDAHLRAMIYRGLVEVIDPDAKTWGTSHRVTRAGELMMELLFEAGLVQHRVLRKPLPPPPPDWADPRPKLVPGAGSLLPSEREELYGTPTNLRDLL